VNELLRIEDLHTQFHVHGGTVKAVDGVNLTIPAKATVGLVGESGSGKSITALSIMRLLEKNGRITAGHVWFRDRDLVGLTEEEMRDVRGNDVSMIFQEPMTALNPVYTCGDQIAKRYGFTRKLSRRPRSTGRSRSCAWSESRTPSVGPGSIRTSSPAECASGS